MKNIKKYEGIIPALYACYDDNGAKRMVKAGDVTYTPDGRGHGIANEGKENLVFMALILLD